MEPNQIPPFPQDGVLPELSKPETSDEADSARAALLEAIETARAALSALPVSPTEVAHALEATEEAPIAPPAHLAAPEPDEIAREPEGKEAPQSFEKEVSLAVEPDAAPTVSPEERAASEEILSSADPIEIHYWRRAQIEAMNEDLAGAFDKARPAEIAAQEIAPLTFSNAPVSNADPDDDDGVPKDFLVGGNDNKDVVLPS